MGIQFLDNSKIVNTNNANICMNNECWDGMEPDEDWQVRTVATKESNKVN